MSLRSMIESLIALEIKKALGPESEPLQMEPSCQDFGLRIAVLDKGFVYIGDVSLDDSFIRIRKARNIRKWGTTKGLGELKQGPLANTVLDPGGDICAPIRSLIFLMEVDNQAWK
jgi:hypothetical protein